MKEHIEAHIADDGCQLFIYAVVALKLHYNNEIARGLMSLGERWQDYIADLTLTDAILDRLLHSAHKIHLQGESMRKRTAAENDKPSTKGKKN